ncbi:MULTISPECIES: ABC transporter ATP-binding protein [Pediococcus]|uniref:ABC transporter ATP-binding protein n=1 Tax=Pediococcus TaxID=1253 RepID=UPI00194E8673|nr:MULTISPECIES: ABC transporter ATP-binding protein [Pediococcus]MBM6585924.1 ABC transporter ATP-binding protein [Pediococcus acidilactici]
MDYKIQVKNVTKEYDLYKSKSDRLKNFFNIKKTDVPHFWSLKGVSLDVKQGETLGIIGVNGSGKSTISNIISGIIPQTTGTVDVKGDTSIISIGAGLKWNLTGLENIRLKGLMQGLSIKEINDIRQDIIDFADIGSFINQPVKDYSTGMRSRLGFAIAVHINPDIIIIDEALSVGDATFYQKCVDKIMEFKKQGKTIVFVSHALGQVEKICDTVAWMHYGELKDVGPAEKVIAEYRAFYADFKAMSAKEKKEYQATKKAEQLDFDVEAYQKELVEEKIAQGSKPTEAKKSVHNVLYKQVLPEKMTLMTRLAVVILVLLMLGIGFSHIMGYSFFSLLENPARIFHKLAAGFIALL